MNPQSSDELAQEAEIKRIEEAELVELYDQGQSILKQFEAIY